jgi:hypothetical protein
MTKLLFIAGLFFTLQLSAQRDTFYCIQILATNHPEFIRAEHINVAIADVYLEIGTDTHRLLVTHDTQDEAEIMLHTWQRVHKDAFLTVRTREQVEDMVRFWVEF